MEDYIKKLLNDPLHADTDSFLKYHKINGPKALSILTKRADPKDENSAVLIQKEVIRGNGYNENGKRKRDTFRIVYKAPRKNYAQKMRNLYIDLFEKNIVEGTILNEEGESGACFAMDGGNGATNASSSGQYVAPVKNKTIRQKTLYITSEQEKVIKKMIEEETVMNTQAGDFGYTANPFKEKKNKFFAAANDHENMMEKSWTDEK
jgi:hypothetical protein